MYKREARDNNDGPHVAPQSFPKGGSPQISELLVPNLSHHATLVPQVSARRAKVPEMPECD